eukprot:m.230662 g.230662  ORF g.230662 m.230662 type:complete len:301 (-) comp10868_c0_seq35:2000-2902(-)
MPSLHPFPLTPSSDLERSGGRARGKGRDPSTSHRKQRKTGRRGGKKKSSNRRGVRARAEDAGRLTSTPSERAIVVPSVLISWPLWVERSVSSSSWRRFWMFRGVSAVTTSCLLQAKRMGTLLMAGWVRTWYAHSATFKAWLGKLMASITNTILLADAANLSSKLARRRSWPGMSTRRHCLEPRVKGAVFSTVDVTVLGKAPSTSWPKSAVLPALLIPTSRIASRRPPPAERRKKTTAAAMQRSATIMPRIASIILPDSLLRLQPSRRMNVSWRLRPDRKTLPRYALLRKQTARWCSPVAT